LVRKWLLMGNRNTECGLYHKKPDRGKRGENIGSAH